MHGTTLQASQRSTSITTDTYEPVSSSRSGLNVAIDLFIVILHTSQLGLFRQPIKFSKATSELKHDVNYKLNQQN